MPHYAQTRASATPVPAILVTSTPENLQAIAPTVTPAPSLTPLPAARLQALESAGEVNVRALPDIESERIGAIAHGTLYPVLRNYYRWYELQYEFSPNGRAWVYGDLVIVDGDTSAIEVIDDLDAVTFAGGAASVLATGAQSEESGANPRTIEISTVGDDPARAVEIVDDAPLPTYTRPAPTQAPFTNQLAIDVADDSPWSNLPPLVPIALLGGLGMLGLIISLLRG